MGHNGNEKKIESNGFEGNANRMDLLNENSFHLHVKLSKVFLSHELYLFLTSVVHIGISFEASRLNIQMKLKIKSIIPEGITKL